MILYYSWFSSIGYCKDSVVSENKCCNDYLSGSNWKVISHGVDPNQKKYNFILLESEKFKKFVIAVPGTRQPGELVTEVVQSYMEPLDNLAGVRVSHYFNKRAKGIIDVIFTETIKRYIAIRQGYQIIFTGHSLGGAVSTILALKAVKNKLINPLKNPLFLSHLDNQEQEMINLQTKS